MAISGTRIIEKADGIYIWDIEGNKLLDGMAGLWCTNIGYGRQELIDAATAQLKELPFYNSFFQCTTPRAIELAELISDIAPAHINHVFFTSSGSEANDTVLRMVRHYWACQGKPDKQTIISRKNAYHGSTVAGASLGGMGTMHKQGGLPIPGIVHIDQPYWFGEGRDEEPEEFGKRVASQLEKKIKELGVDKVAAFIAEPIQGAGGVIVPPESYWPEIQRICDQYEILLICDEVICGFGRTGEWFGSDYFGVKADLMPIAKGLSSGYLPIGGVMISDRVAEVINAGGDFNHGYTYSGHPVAAAVAIANIKILRDEKIIERVKEDIAPYFQQQIRTLVEHSLVGEVRGVGLLGAFELVQAKEPLQFFENKDEAGAIVRDLCIENNLVMRAVGSTMILCPPLVITREQIDELVNKVRKTFDMAVEKLH